MSIVLLGAVIFWIVAASTLLAVLFRRPLVDAWREPVLRSAVLILESDDWGYGPPEQASALHRLAVLLASYRDRSGRSPVMTLGIVLAGPDTASIRADACRRYHRISLTAPDLSPTRVAMLTGLTQGVFALQLHGREHFWPECLMRAARSNSDIRTWLTVPAFPSSESLPPPLQSRWIDATELPSRPLPPARVAAEAKAEVREFVTLIGHAPEVAVPPTFVWTHDVESAWAHAGIRVVVTPGRRSEARDAQGRLVYADSAYYNGRRSTDGLVYVVRDTYFEPALGHLPTRAIEALADKSRQGRPTLVEIHRSNFIGDAPVVNQAYEALGQFLRQACEGFPSLRFMSTAELAAHYRERSDLVEKRVALRIHFALRRLAAVPKLFKLACLTGVVVPAWLAYLGTQPRWSPRSP